MPIARLSYNEREVAIDVHFTDGRVSTLMRGGRCHMSGQLYTAKELKDMVDEKNARLDKERNG